MDFLLAFDISAAAVFLQGIFSFFSPCVLPLLPVYLGYLSGGATEGRHSGSMRYRRSKVFVNTVFFVIGISAALFLLGMGVSAAGSVFVNYQGMIMRVGGVIMILFGLYQLDLLGDWEFMAKERRLPFRIETLATSPLMALILGFVFSFAWTPCVGPMLSSVLILAAVEPEQGMTLIMLYTLGFVIPFLILGLFSERVLNLLKKYKNIMRFTVRAGGVVMIILGILLFTGQLHATGNTASQNGQIQSGTQDGVNGGSEGNAALAFTLKDQYGKTHTLSDYKGKVIFLNFWATWCPPCREEMPDIQKLYERSPQEGEDAVIVLGVAAPKLGSEKDATGIRAFMEENGYTYPVLMDNGGELFQAYGIRVLPTTYMIDRSGNIVGKVQGALSAENIERVVKQTLSGKTK